MKIRKGWRVINCQIDEDVYDMIEEEKFVKKRRKDKDFSQGSIIRKRLRCSFEEHPTE